MHHRQLKKLVRIFLLSSVYAATVYTAERIEQRHNNRALMQAVEQTDVDRVESLLKNGANPNHRRSFSGQTVLMAAVSAPFKDTFDIIIIARMLLRSGADAQAVKTVHDGITALHCVVPRTDIPNHVAAHLIMLLLDAGARRDVKARSSYAHPKPLWLTPIQQAEHKKIFWKDRYQMLSTQFARRQACLRNYCVGGIPYIDCDGWLADSHLVAQLEKSAQMLRVEDVRAQALAQKATRIHAQRDLRELRPDLFKVGW